MTTSTQAPLGRRQRPAPISTTVIRTETLSAGMVRVVVGGAGLERFEANEFSDAYVKLVFRRPDVAPQQRTYTVRSWDPAVLEMTIDFVVHGDAGLAGPWARSAVPGDELLILGPGGGYAPAAAASAHLLAGDESALPAIAAALERLPADARGWALVEVDDDTHEQALTAPAGVEVRWLHRAGRPLGEPLLAAVSGLDLPAEGLQAFVHGEAGVVRHLRRLLKVERGLPLSALSISGYWRVGQDDEAWRAVKRDFNRATEEEQG